MGTTRTAAQTSILGVGQDERHYTNHPNNFLLMRLLRSRRPDFRLLAFPQKFLLGFEYPLILLHIRNILAHCDWRSYFGQKSKGEGLGSSLQLLHARPFQGVLGLIAYCMPKLPCNEPGIRTTSLLCFCRSKQPSSQITVPTIKAVATFPGVLSG